MEQAREEQNDWQSIGKSREGWNTKIHMLASNARQAVKFALSPGNAPEGRKLLRRLGNRVSTVPLLMNRAYEGGETRQQAKAMGLNPVVPPKKSRLHPWQYDKEFVSKAQAKQRGCSDGGKGII